MRAISGIIVTVLLVGITIALGLLSYTFVLSSMSSPASTAGAKVATIGAGMVEVVSASLSTPYTWKVVLQNLSDQNLDISTLQAMVERDGKVCGISEGVLGEHNVLLAKSVDTYYFYGDLDCRLTEGDWTITVTNKYGFTAKKKLTLPSDIYLWIPFKSVHDMDWSGKHKVYFHSDDALATLSGLLDFNIEGIPQYAQRCKFAGCLFFDGNDDAVWYENNYAFSSAFTITAWVKIVGPSVSDQYNRQTIFRLHIPGDYNNYIFLRTAKSIQKFMFALNYEGNAHEIYAPTEYEYNKWYFVAAELNNGCMYLYIDGMEVNSLCDSNYLNLSIKGYLLIAKYSINVPNTEAFHGYIDDLRVYLHALTPSELNLVMQGQLLNDEAIRLTFDRNTIDSFNSIAHDTHMWANSRLSFGGKDYISIPLEDANVQGLRQASMTFWASISPHILETSTGYAVDVGYTSSSGKAAFTVLYDTTTQQLQAWIETLDGNYARVGYSITPTRNLHFIAVVYNEPCLRLYVDGALEANRCDLSGGITSLAQLTVGKWSGSYHRGSIDELRIYSRALTGSEIKCIYEDSDCLIGDENLLVYYTFDHPDYAWQDVPDWHHTSRAPKASASGAQVSASEGEFFVSQAVRVNTPTTMLFVFAPAVEQAPSTNGHVVAYLNAGGDSTFHFYHAQTLDAPEYVGTGVDTGGSTYIAQVVGDVWDVGSPNISASLYGVELGTYINGRLETNTYPGIDLEGTLFIGTIDGSTSTAEGKYRVILALQRKLPWIELNAICKLFGRC